MSRNADGERRVSAEQTRLFRTARLEYVRIGRITGMDPHASALLREWDLAAPGLLQIRDWSKDGLLAMALVRPAVVVGCVEGDGPLGWVANPEVLLAAQGHLAADTLFPVICLAHQITQRTRIHAAGAGLFAACSAALNAQLPAATTFRLWQALIKAELNPLSSTNKMAFVRVTGCDPRKLPSARQPKEAEGAAA